MISVTSLLHRSIIIYHLKNISPFTFFFSQEKSHSGFWFFFFFWIEMVRNNFATNPTARIFPNPQAPGMLGGIILPTRAVQDFEFESS